MIAIAKWIAQDNLDAAHRFLEAVEETMDGLRSMPGKGSPKHLRGALSKVRTWAVRGFPNHLIVYEIRSKNEVYVYTIVHGNRRYQRLLRDRLP